MELNLAYQATLDRIPDGWDMGFPWCTLSLQQLLPR